MTARTEIGQACHGCVCGGCQAYWLAKREGRVLPTRVEKASEDRVLTDADGALTRQQHAPSRSPSQAAQADPQVDPASRAYAESLAANIGAQAETPHRCEADCRIHHYAAPAQAGEVERLIAAAVNAHYCYHQLCLDGHGEGVCSDAAAIDALADAARRMEKENAALAEQAFEANADAVKAYEERDDAMRLWHNRTEEDRGRIKALEKERDEARLLHDEHCEWPQPGFRCAPPWRR